MIEPPETVLTDSVRVVCDGSSAIRGGPALGHPRVWLEIDDKGWTECSYCDRRFVLRGGPAERGMREVSTGELPPPADGSVA